MNIERTLLDSVFSGRAWRSSSEALFEATGLAVAIMDSTACSVIDSTIHCTYCQIIDAGRGSVPGSCFDDPPYLADEGVTRTSCRAGLSCHLAPIVIDGTASAILFVGGYVSSARERKSLFDRLVAERVPESQARLALRGMPIMSRREIDGLVNMARVVATEILESACQHLRLVRRIQELEAFAVAGRELVKQRGTGQDLFEAVLRRGMTIVGADSGSLMLMRPGTDLLEVVASCGDASHGALDKAIHVGEGIAGRVAATRRSVLITGPSDPMIEHSVYPGRDIFASISVPLLDSDALVGVMNLNSSCGGKPFGGQDLRRIEQYASFAASLIAGERAYHAARRWTCELVQLGSIASALSASADIDEVMSFASSLIEKSFSFEIAGVALTGWGMNHAVVVLDGDHSSSDIDAVLAKAAGREGASKPFDHIRIVTHRGTLITESDGGLWNVTKSELVLDDSATVLGFLFIASRSDEHFGADDYRLLEGIAHQITLALERVMLLRKARDGFTCMSKALSVTLDAIERSSRGHTGRVKDYATMIAEKMELASEQVELLQFAGLLHDVGKICVPKEILLKPSKLTEAEMAKVCRHSEIGASIVGQIDSLKEITPIIMHHHEQWSGNGYPKGLAGEQIPLLARILAVADAFEAMISDRPYRRRLSLAEARVELEAFSGIRYDPAVVAALIEALDRGALAGSRGLLTIAQHKDQYPT